MGFELWIFQLPVALEIPKSVFTWLVWGMGILLVIGTCIGFKKFIFHIQRRRIWLFIIFLLLQPILSLSLCVRVEAQPGSSLLVPVLSSVPWITAAGLIGPVPSLILAILSGVFSAIWSSHNIFDPIVIGVIALLFNWTVQQNYRSRFFSALRHPALSFLFGFFVYIPLVIISDFSRLGSTSGPLISSRVETSWMFPASYLMNYLVGMLIAEIIFAVKKSPWYRPKTFDTAKLDRNTSRKYLLLSVILGLIVLSIGFFITWHAAVAQVQAILITQMESLTASVEKGLPLLINSGKSILNSDVAVIKEYGTYRGVNELAQNFEKQTYFQEIFLIDMNDSVLLHAPAIFTIDLSNEDQARMMNSAGRDSLQIYTDEDNNEQGYTLSFLASITDENGAQTGFLLARSRLSENSEAILFFSQINNLRHFNGKAALQDEYGRMVVTSLAEPDQAGGMEGLDLAENSMDLVKTRVFQDPPWRLTLIIPGASIVAQAQKIAIPSSILLSTSIVFFIAIFYFFIRSYYARIVKLRQAVVDSFELKSDFTYPVDTVDEIGVLGESIKTLHQVNKERISDQTALLRSSTAIVQTQELKAIVQPVFDALLNKGCDSVRLILSFPNQGTQTLSHGDPAALFAHLDKSILEAVTAQGNIILPHVVRNRGLNIPAGMLTPASLAGFALENRNSVFGALWIGYQEPVIFRQDDISAIVALKNELQNSLISFSEISNLRQTQVEYESLLHKLPVGLVVLDEAGYIKFTNQTAQSIPGLLALNCINLPYSDAIQIKKVQDMVSNDSLDSILNLEMPDGRSYQVQMVGWEKEKLLILKNASAEKKDLTLQKNLLLTVSHDIRSPLTLIKGYLSMIEVVGGINNQQKSYLEKIGTASDQIGRLSSDLLDLRRLESDNGLRLEAFPISELLQEIENYVEPLAGQKGIAFSVTADRALNLTADKLLIKQAVINLLDNAFEFSTIGKRIDLIVAADNGSCRFQVIDQGAGIAPIDLPKLFSPGFHVNKMDDSDSGTSGYGLMIVKYISEIHRGKVWVESRLGKGSTFTIEIPLK